MAHQANMTRQSRRGGAWTDRGPANASARELAWLRACLQKTCETSSDSEASDAAVNDKSVREPVSPPAGAGASRKLGAPHFNGEKLISARRLPAAFETNTRRIFGTRVALTLESRGPCACNGRCVQCRTKPYGRTLPEQSVCAEEFCERSTRGARNSRPRRARERPGAPRRAAVVQSICPLDFPCGAARKDLLARLPCNSA